MHLEELTIDPEFHGLCPALTTEERSLLEASLSAEGCREPIIVWANHEDTILDGHNRYEICRSLRIPCKTKALKFDSREEAALWILNNQLGRRNLTDEKRSYLRGQKYARLKKTTTNESGKNQHSEDEGQNVPQPRTSSVVAAEEGVDEKTIRRDEKYAEALDRIEKSCGEQAKADILDGKLKAKKRQIVAVAELPAKEQRAAIKAIREGRKPESRESGPRIFAEGAAEQTTSIADMQEGKFACIYADPPWAYGNQATRAATNNHYPTMTVEQLCEMPVASKAAADAHLHLWTTNSFLFDAHRVIEAWGFEYRSCFVWVKPQMGIGNYWRVSHEFLLLGIRGNAKRFNDHGMSSWGSYARAKHSAKPEEIRNLIERASAGPYLELFGRKPVAGWTVYGNQINEEKRLFA